MTKDAIHVIFFKSGAGPAPIQYLIYHKLTAAGHDEPMWGLCLLEKNGRAVREVILARIKPHLKHRVNILAWRKFLRGSVEQLLLR